MEGVKLILDGWRGMATRRGFARRHLSVIGWQVDTLILQHTYGWFDVENNDIVLERTLLIYSPMRRHAAVLWTRGYHHSYTWRRGHWTSKMARTVEGIRQRPASGGMTLQIADHSWNLKPKGGYGYDWGWTYVHDYTRNQGNQEPRQLRLWRAEKLLVTNTYKAHSSEC